MTLKEQRQNIAEVVGNSLGIPAFAYVPARINPPLAVVIPGTPYLSAPTNQTYGALRFTGRWEVVVVVLGQVNETSTTQLDQYLEAALMELAVEGFEIESVGDAYTFSANGGSHLATRITVTNQISL